MYFGLNRTRHSCSYTAAAFEPPAKGQDSHQPADNCINQTQVTMASSWRWGEVVVGSPREGG